MNLDEEDDEIFRAVNAVPTRPGYDDPKPNGHAKAQPEKEAPAPPFEWDDISEWGKREPPDIPYVVRDVIPRDQVTLLSGHGAAGKSTIALQLAAATTLGQPWLHYETQQGPVFFIDTDDNPVVMETRLNAIARFHGKPIAEMIAGGLKIKSLSGKETVLATVDRRTGLLQVTDLFKSLLEEARALKPKLVIVGSSSDMFAGNELDRHQVAQFINKLKAPAMDAGGATLLVAHVSLTGMSTSSGLSGSTQWHNSARSRIYFRNPTKKENGDDDDEGTGNIRVLDFKKNSYGKIAGQVVLEWRDDVKLFLPRPGENNLDKLAKEARADELTIMFLKP